MEVERVDNKWFEGKFKGKGLFWVWNNWDFDGNEMKRIEIIDF